MDQRSCAERSTWPEVRHFSLAVSTHRKVGRCALQPIDRYFLGNRGALIERKKRVIEWYQPTFQPWLLLEVNNNTFFFFLHSEKSSKSQTSASAKVFKSAFRR
jgi:hypothetical protein